MAEVQTWPGSKIKDYCILNAKRMVEKFKRDRPPVMPTGLVDEPGSFAMGGLVGRGPHFARVEHEKVLHMECRADDRRVQERIRTGILGINWCTLVPLLSQAILLPSPNLHCEEASDHLLEPSPLLGDRFVHAPSQFLLDPPERCPHAIAPCCSFDKEKRYSRLPSHPKNE